MRPVHHVLVAFALAALAACINHDYEPCAGKAVGAPCRVCPQNDPSCIETMEVKACNAAGTCQSTGQSTAPKPDTRNDGHAWLVDQGGGFCLGSTGVVDAPDGDALWLGASGGLFHVTARDPATVYGVDKKALEVGVVTWLGNLRGATFVEFEGEELVRFAAGDERRSFGKGVGHPVAVTANGCVGVKKGDDLSVLVPGASDLRGAVLPRSRPQDAPLVDGAVGLGDALLVRAFRAESGSTGALYRVACPSLAVQEIAHGAAVQNLTDLTLTDTGRLYAVDRLNADQRNYRLVQSDDDGVTWSASPVPAGFQASRIAARGRFIVVVPPKTAAILYSTNGGASFTLEALDAYSATNLTTASAHVSADGVVTVGAECNYLLHRRAPLP